MASEGNENNDKVGLINAGVGTVAGAAVGGVAIPHVSAWRAGLTAEDATANAKKIAKEGKAAFDEAMTKLKPELDAFDTKFPGAHPRNFFDGAAGKLLPEQQSVEKLVSSGFIEADAKTMYTEMKGILTGNAEATAKLSEATSKISQATRITEHSGSITKAGSYLEGLGARINSMSHMGKVGAIVAGAAVTAGAIYSANHLMGSRKYVDELAAANPGTGNSRA